MGLVLLLSQADAVGASILEDVLFQIDLMGSSPLSAVMINLAENIAVPLQSSRTLRAGEQVVVGYGVDGTPVEVLAGQAGVWVSPDTAHSLQTGLEAGLYPVGSQLYDLPPAGQLSLFEQSREGAALVQAQELLMSRIDGSITNIIIGIQPYELAPSELAQVYSSTQDNDLLAMETIDSTVLGAVNSGQIVTHVAAEWRQGTAAEMLGIQLAQISAGSGVQIDEAMTVAAQAISVSSYELGGAPDSAALLLNQATNASAITARVLNIVQQQNLRVGDIVTTAIGAINAGSVNPQIALP